MSFNFSFEFGEAFDLLVRFLPILIPAVAVQLLLTITAVVSLARKPNPWNEKIAWLLLVLFVNLIGAIIYFAVGASYLDNKYAERQDGSEEH